MIDNNRASGLPSIHFSALDVLQEALYLRFGEVPRGIFPHKTGSPV